MRSAATVLAAVGLVVASLAALVIASGDSERAVQPEPFEYQFEEPMRQSVAEYAAGRRVLWIDAGAAGGPEARVLESARAGGTWALYDPAPPAASEFAELLDRVARSAAAEFAGTGGIRGATLTALARLDVTFLVAHDEREWVAVETTDGDRVERVGRGLRLRKAEPCVQLVEPEVARAAVEVGDGPLGWMASLETAAAVATDIDLQPVREGSLTLTASEPSTYLLAFPVEGALVSVGGTVVERPDSLGPLLLLELPAGRHEVSVRYRETDIGQWLGVAGALGLFVGLGLLLVSLRARVAASQALAEAAEREIAAAAALQDQAEAAGSASREEG